MNPYLEHPELWHQVHNRLIVGIADAIADQIAPQYRVSIEQRIYQSFDDPRSIEALQMSRSSLMFGIMIILAALKDLPAL